MPGVTLIYAIRALAQKMEPGEEIRLPRNLQDQFGPDDHNHFMGLYIDLHFLGDEVIIRKTQTYGEEKP